MRRLPAFEYDVPDEFRLDQLAFSPDGRTLAICGGDWHHEPRVALWDVESRELRKTAAAPTHAPPDLFTYSRDGRFIAFASEQTLYLLGSESLQILGKYGPLTGARFTSVDFASDGRFLAAGDWDGFLRCWDVDSRRELLRAPRLPDMIAWVLVLPGDTQAMIGTPSALHTWDLESGSLVKCIQVPKKCGREWRHHASRDRKTVVSITNRGYLIRYDVPSGEVVAEYLRAARGHVRCLSPDAAHLAVGRGDGTLLLWDLLDRQRWSRQKTSYGSVESLEFSPDGSRLACLGTAAVPDGTVRQGLTVFETGLDAPE